MARNFCREHMRDPKTACDPRSIRTVVSGKARVLTCCPKGQWQPRKEWCRASLKAVSIMRPLEHEKCVKRKGRDWKTKGYPLEGIGAIRTIRNKYTIRGVKSEGLPPIVLETELVNVGGRWWVSLWRDGVPWGEDMRPSSIFESLSYAMPRGNKAYAVKKLMAGMGPIVDGLGETPWHERIEFNRPRTWAILGGSLALFGWWMWKMSKKSTSAPPGPRTVIALGDSITANGGYHRELLRLLNESAKNQGSGGRFLGYVGQGINVVRSHLAEAVAANPTDLIVLAGINDLPGGNVAAMKQRLEALWQEAKDSAPGARLIAVKLTPSLGYATLKSRLPEWLAFNAWIQDHSLPDVVVDLSFLGDAQGRYLPGMSGDKLHPSAAGQKAIGEAIYKGAFA